MDTKRDSYGFDKGDFSGIALGTSVLPAFSNFSCIKLIFGHFWDPLKIRAGAQNGPKKSIRRPVSVQKRPKDAQKPFLDEFEKHTDFRMHV